MRRPQKGKEKALKPSGFKAFSVAGAEGLELAPLAVPETADARFCSRRFDRCANACSLHPPQAARAGVARHAPRASGSLLLYKTRKTSAQAEVFLVWQGQKGSNPRHADLERLSGKEKSPKTRRVEALAASQNRF